MKIKIYIEDGVVFDVQYPSGFGIEVDVHDYDIGDTDPDNLETDPETGEQYRLDKW